jgi:hypothetical protein
MSLSVEDLVSSLASNGDGISTTLRNEEKALLYYIKTVDGSEARLKWRDAHEKSVESLQSLLSLSVEPTSSTTAMENAPRLLGTVQVLAARIDAQKRKAESLDQDHVTRLQELLSTYLEQSSRILRKIPDPTSTGAEASTSSPKSAEGTSDESSVYTLAPEVITAEPESEVALEESTDQEESTSAQETAAQDEDIDADSEPTVALDLQQLAALLNQNETDLQTAKERFELYRDAPFGGEQAFKPDLDAANHQWLSSRKTFLEALSTYTGTDHTKLQLGGVQQGVEQMLTEAKKKTADLQQELSSLAESSTQAEGQSLNDDIITKYVETSSGLADLINPKQYEPQVGRF